MAASAVETGGNPTGVTVFTVTGWASLDVAQQNDVAGSFATSQQQPLSIRRPIEVENPAGSELGDLLRIASLQRLFPDVRCAVLRQRILEPVALRRPARSREARRHMECFEGRATTSGYDGQRPSRAG